MLKTIIRVTKDDGSYGWVHSIQDTIEITDNEQEALKMDFQTTLSVALALGTLKVPHAMISKFEKDD